MSKHTRFGAAMPSVLERSSVRSAYTDPRLRGLPESGLSGARPPLTRTERKFLIRHPDPYDEAMRREEAIGMRSPMPYEEPAALAGQLPMTPSAYTELHSDHAIYPAANVAGRRMTQAGTFGIDIAQSNPWTAREQLGYAQNRGGAVGGYWDGRGVSPRRSGRLKTVTSFSQNVDHRFPFLHLVAKGNELPAPPEDIIDGNAHVRVIAGLFDTGGAQASREFWLGGGLTARFCLDGWDQCTIEVLDIVEGTNVQFAWVTQGLQSSDGQGTLYLPQRIDLGGALMPVPEGAYALILEDPDLAALGTTIRVIWTTLGAAFPGNVTLSIDVDDGTTGTSNQFGQPLQVLGTAFNIPVIGALTTIDAVWLINSI